MAQEKDERPGAAARKPGENGEEGARKSAATGATAGAAAGAIPGRPGSRGPEGTEEGGVRSPLARRRERYLIGRRAAAAPPFAPPAHSMDDVVAYLNRLENVEVVKRLSLGGARPFSADGHATDELVVAKLEDDRAQWLRSVAPPHLVIERDAPLGCADYLSSPLRSAPLAALLPLRSVATEVIVRVLGERDQPLARASVLIDGGGLPVQALTDDSGVARVSFFGGSLEEIDTLLVRAPANHWDRVMRAPRLASGANTVRLRPLAELYPGFPGTRLLGWGLRLMEIDPARGRFTGSGVKIGVIDSGCDNSHPLLRHVTRGRDFIGGAVDGWTQDALAHGTHCAGIVTAGGSGQGIMGCAPEAELHAFKVIPGGRVSDLLAALAECMERELDLIHIGVVIDGFSELVAQRLGQLRDRGVLCVAAAGNSGGPVGFPASLPGVAAVAAVGRLKEFPVDSSHAYSVSPGPIGSDGVFAASFSSLGPQIALSAPGVAIVSTVPGGGYAAADGTSAAAAHVTGFAALVLAHHPLFQESYSMRSAQRAHALLELLRASAVQRVPDPQRGGAGVPDLPRVPGGFPLGQPAAESLANAAAMAPYWQVPDQAWLAGWSAGLGARALGGGATRFY
jgi:subtilisin